MGGVDRTRPPSASSQRLRYIYPSLLLFPAARGYPNCLWTNSTMRAIVRSTAGDAGFRVM